VAKRWFIKMDVSSVWLAGGQNVSWKNNFFPTPTIIADLAELNKQVEDIEGGGLNAKN
jgi:hypothetical protein